MYEEYVGKEMLLEDAVKLRGKVNLCGIYSITNKTNCKVYVGQSTCIYARAASHAKCIRSNVHLQNAIAKYGIDNFVHKVELLCTEEELSENEVGTFDKYKNAGTIMYNVAECGGGGNTLKYACAERKEEAKTRLKATLASRTAEEVADTTAIRNVTLANRTAEEIAETSTKMSISIKSTLANRTAEEIAEWSAKRKTTLANRTAEEIAETSAKMSANYTAKYCNIVEDIIKFCLQNKLFTFGKYKKICNANNLEVQVSVAFFGRIMRFATYKEQLHEFVSIYKHNMDYNTYCSLCKLKPITKDVFSVTAKYSTYKYFI